MVLRRRVGRDEEIESPEYESAVPPISVHNSRIVTAPSTHANALIAYCVLRIVLYFCASLNPQ